MSDTLERAAALNPSASFIVQAPAGSGKTELLTQRYLKLLAYQQAPEEILAVTFTRKAAAQMRQRILLALKNAQNDPPPAAHERTTWELAQAVLKKDLQLSWDLQKNPNRLRIVTIDALCAYIVNRMPILSHFGGVPEMVDFPESDYKKAVALLLKETTLTEKWAASLQAILLHLDNQIENVSNLLVSLLQKRDQWLPYLGGIASENVDLENYLNQCLIDIIGTHLQQVRNKFTPQMQDALIPLIKNAVLYCEKIGINTPLACCATLDTLPNITADNILQWEAIGDLLTTQTNTWRKAFQKNNGFPSPSEAKDKDEKALRKAHKENMQAFMESILHQEDLLESLCNIRNLPPIAISAQQCTVLHALAEILPILVGFLQLVFQESGKVDFTEVTLRAQQALGDELHPTDIALSLDYQLRHILIDEYQDTSITQYRLFEKLVSGWQNGDGRTLFLVGDPMQSIYRFRGAEVSLFMKTLEQGLGGITLTPLALKVNFRSTANVIAWINETFIDIFPKVEDISLGGVSYSPATSCHPECSEGSQAVQIHPVSSDACVDTQVLALIQAAQQQHPEGSIAVLVRAKKHLVGIIHVLKNAGIPFVAHEVEHLAKRHHVIDLLSLLKATQDWSDAIAWYAVLRAPWIGLTLEDILVLHQHNHNHILWQVIENFDNIAELSKDAKARLAKCVPIFQYWLQEAHRHQLAHWLRGLWNALGGAACYSAPHFILDMDKAFALIAGYPHGLHLTDIEELEKRLSELYGDIIPQNTEETRMVGKVELMTIHKAKGLEFDTVIMPHIHAKPKVHTPSLLLWFERNHAKGIDLILAPKRSQKEEVDALYQYVAKQIQKKGEFENARLLYVGATRAKSHLHLVTVCEEDQKPPSGSFLAMLWPHVTQPMSIIQAAKLPTEEAPTSLYRLTLDWKLPSPIQDKIQQLLYAIPSEDNNIPEEGDNIFRNAGIVFHRVVQQWVELQMRPDVLPPGIEQAVRLALKRLGLAETALQQALSWVLQGLNNMIEDPMGRWILDPTHTQKHTEWALSMQTSHGVENNIIDYAFIDKEDTRWIVDYKLSHSALTEAGLREEIAQYRKQLQKYHRMLSLQDKRHLRAMLYFPLAKTSWELS